MSDADIDNLHDALRAAGVHPSQVDPVRFPVHGDIFPPKQWVEPPIIDIGRTGPRRIPTQRPLMLRALDNLIWLLRQRKGQPTQVPRTRPCLQTPLDDLPDFQTPAYQRKEAGRLLPSVNDYRRRW